MVFKLDKKPILELDAPSNTSLAIATCVFSISIAINQIAYIIIQKWK